jgi:glycosyltransferase involved in cell wall biosynthesis
MIDLRDSVEPQPGSVSVVIPTLNEERNLPHVLRRLPDGIDEVLIVDGRSTDRTVDVARETLPGVTIVQQKGQGKGDALRTGFDVARGDVIVMLDADGSTDPAEIPRFVAALMTGADMAKGTRFVTGGGSGDLTWGRRVGNYALSKTVNVLYGSSFSDLCYGYNAFWRRCLPALDIDCDGFEVETLIALRAMRAGLRIVEVPSFELPRRHGESNLSPVRDGARVLRTILQEVRARPDGTEPIERCA